MKKMVLIFSLIALLSFPSVTQAATLTLEPSLDATVKLSAPDTSFGAGPSLDAYYESGTDPTRVPGEVQEALIKFDLSSVPSNKYITSALLVLHSYGTTTFGYGDIRFRANINTWDNSVTWNTRPGYVAESSANLEVTNNEFPDPVTLTGLVRGWYSKQIPNYGMTMRAFGDGDYSSGLFTGSDAHASSKEGGSPPQLIITYSDTPPSATPAPGTSGGGSGTGGTAGTGLGGSSSSSSSTGQIGNNSASATDGSRSSAGEGANVFLRNGAAGLSLSPTVNGIAFNQTKNSKDAKKAAAEKADPAVARHKRRVIIGWSVFILILIVGFGYAFYVYRTQIIG